MKRTFFGREVQQILLGRPFLHPGLALALHLAYTHRLRISFRALTPLLPPPLLWYRTGLSVLVCRVIGRLISPLWRC